MERMIVEYLANACWQLPLLAAGAWVLLRLAGMNAAAQHRVWVAVLALGLVLPLEGWQQGDVVPARTLAMASSPTLYLGETFDSAAPADPAGTAKGTVTRAGTGLSWSGYETRVHRIEMNATAAAWITYLVLAVALFGLLRIAMAWGAARRLVRDSRKVVFAARMTELLAESSRRLGVKPPQMRRSREIAGPVVVGAAEPVLLWPVNFAEFGEDELMAALCHEMAHIRRHDYLMNLICEGAGLPLRWHPVIHWVGRRIRSTREMACDAMAAEAMQSEKVYARSLLSLAQSMVLGTAGGGSSAAAGLFNGNALEERMMCLTQGKTAMSARARVVRSVAGAAAMMLTVGLAAMFHVVPAMAQTQTAAAPSDTAAQRVQGGAPNAAQGELREGVQENVVSPEVKVNPVAPVVTVAPVVRVRPVVQLAAISPVVKGAPIVKVSPVMKVAPIVKVSPAMKVLPIVQVSPLNHLEKISPVLNVTPEITLVPKVMQAVPETQAKPAQGSRTGSGKGQGAGKGSGSGSGHRIYAIVDGQERELTPEERRKVEAQLAQALKGVTAATVRLNSAEFRKQMEDAQPEAGKAAAELNSPKFQKQMEEARKQVAQATARLNSPEFKKQMEDAQLAAEEAAAKINSAEFQKQMADAQKQIAEATARLNGPEFRQQMEKAQRDAAEAAAKMNSAEFQKKMADAQKEIADAMARMAAEQERDSDGKEP